MTMDRSDRDYLDARFGEVRQEIRGLRDTNTAEHLGITGRIKANEERIVAIERTGATRLWAIVVAGIAAGLGALVGTIQGSR